MKILFTSDHAGFELKGKLIPFVQELGYEVEDLGPHELNQDDDYPDFISSVAQKVSAEPDSTRGIVIGGSGQGEAMVANRFNNVRAATFYGCSLEVIKLSREHNNANVLSIGARFINENEAQEAVKLWLETQFSEDERHVRRIKKIDQHG
jgi:ribose 5-phosphate isomerase B|tara:strand:- start:53416 stop:53865 length:450 start_codon:yes stop_codon:yes gene_type:complete